MSPVAMSPRQADIISEAARHFKVHILVRQTNRESLKYIGQQGFAPKRLDCKAKTADCDVLHPRLGSIGCAGLVVDPTVVGKDAFASAAKHASAMKEWTGFAATMLHPEVRSWEGQQSLTYIPGGKLYFVDLNPTSPRHGCVKFTSSGLISAGCYIHGDFDLYGIVPADDPSRNVAVHEKRLGQAHSRSPEFLDVQIYINRRIDAPMVLHGAQEAYAREHSDEALDVFHPDSKISSVNGAGEIARLYATRFEGRKLFTKGGKRQIVRGGFVTPA